MLTSVVKFGIKPINSMLLILGLAFGSCEQVKEDILPQSSFERLDSRTLYAVPGDPIVVNLMEEINILEPITIQIQQKPSEGELKMVANSLAMYEIPSTRGGSTNDDFEISIDTDSVSYQLPFRVEIIDRTGFPLSEQGAVYDRGGIIKPGETITVDVLANDRKGASNLQIEVAPDQGAAIITSDQKLEYTANEAFLGLVDVFYKVEFPDGRIGRANTRFSITNE